MNIINSQIFNDSFYQKEFNFTAEVYEIPIIYGDVNNDYIVNIADILLLVNIIFSSDVDQWIGSGADANQNGSIDVTDIITIVGFILGTG